MSARRGADQDTARLAQQATERDEQARQASDLDRRLRELRRSVVEREAHLVTVQDELDADRAEIDRIDLREGPPGGRHRGGPLRDGHPALGRRGAGRSRAAMSEPHTANDATVADSAEQWDLCLYVTDRSPKCLRAIDNLRRACEEHLAGHYHIEVVDLLENPRLAADDQILGRAHGGAQVPVADPQARRRPVRQRPSARRPAASAAGEHREMTGHGRLVIAGH